MELKLSEFDVNFSAMLANLGACGTNYSEQTQKQMIEAKSIIEKLETENKKLREELAKLKPEKKNVPAPKN